MLRAAKMPRKERGVWDHYLPHANGLEGNIEALGEETMGVDLALLPVEAEHENEKGRRWGFSHSVLSMDRDRTLFTKLQTLKTKPVPADFATYLCRDDKFEEPHYGQTQEDPYGDKLGTVPAGVLARYADEARDGDINRAVFAYLAALPQTMPVALYWH